MRGVLRALLRGTQVAFRKPVTVPSPDERRELPARARTFPFLIWNHDLNETNCTGCAKCCGKCEGFLKPFQRSRWRVGTPGEASGG